MLFVSRLDEVHDMAIMSAEHTEVSIFSETYSVVNPVELYREDDAVLTPVGNRLFAFGDGDGEAVFTGKGPPAVRDTKVFPDATLYSQEFSRFPDCKFFVPGPKKTIFAAGNPNRPLTVYISEPAGKTKPYRDSPYSTEKPAGDAYAGQLSTVDILMSNATEITALSSRGDQIVVHTDKGCHILYAPSSDQASTGYRVEQVAATNFSAAVNTQVVAGEAGSMSFWLGHDGQIYKDESASRGAEDAKSFTDPDQASWKSKGLWEKELPVDLSESFSAYDRESGMYWLFVRSDEHDFAQNGVPGRTFLLKALPELPGEVLNLDADAEEPGKVSLVALPDVPGKVLNLDELPIPGQAGGLTAKPDVPGKVVLVGLPEKPGKPGTPEGTPSDPGKPFTLVALPDKPGKVGGLTALPDVPGKVLGLGGKTNAPGKVPGLNAEPDVPGKVLGLDAEPDVPGKVLGLQSGGNVPGKVPGLTAEPDVPGKVPGLTAVPATVPFDPDPFAVDGALLSTGLIHWVNNGTMTTRFAWVKDQEPFRSIAPVTDEADLNSTGDATFSRMHYSYPDAGTRKKTTFGWVTDQPFNWVVVWSELKYGGLRDSNDLLSGGTAMWWRGTPSGSHHSWTYDYKIKGLDAVSQLWIYFDVPTQQYKAFCGALIPTLGIFDTTDTRAFRTSGLFNGEAVVKKLNKVNNHNEAFLENSPFGSYHLALSGEDFAFHIGTDSFDANVTGSNNRKVAFSTPFGNLQVQANDGVLA